MLRLWLSMFVVVVPLTAQQPPLERRAIDFVRQISVSSLEPGLPDQTLEKWLTDAVGSSAAVRWEVNDCGEQSGNPVVDRGRDFPLCVDAIATLPGDRQAIVTIVVGTFQKGLTGVSKLLWVNIGKDSQYARIPKLSDLPARISATTVPCEPVNPHATPEARALLKTICGVSGKGILAGQHNFVGHGSRYSDHASDVTGKYPYVWGSDFGFTASGKDGIDSRDKMIDEAKRQYAAGSIITLMWHAVKPTDDEPNDWTHSVCGKLTDAEWKDLITPGTALNKRWMAQADNVATYLKRLQEARIPVLWRPYHEANHGWAWWGGRPGPSGFQALYRMMFDRYVNFHHLDNLVWVWDSKTPGGPTEPYAGYYPGHRYSDILATDAYSGYPQSHHDQLAAIAEGRPIALGEVGAAPTPAILKQQPLWTWFMVWTDFFDNNNKRDDMVKLFNDPGTLTRGIKLR